MVQTDQSVEVDSADVENMSFAITIINSHCMLLTLARTLSPRAVAVAHVVAPM